jgi:glycosyltransferase involved in cell wall biosynthesis
MTSIPFRLARFACAVHRGTRGGDLLFVSDYGLPPALVNGVRRLPLVIKIVGDFAWEYSIRHGHCLETTGIEEFQNLAGGPRVRALKALQRAYVAAADRVIVPSRYLRRIVSGWGIPASKIKVIHNAVPVPEQPASPDCSRAVILTAARLAPWKGIDTLIRAVSQLADLEPAPHLVVAGDGDDRDRLERLARELAPERVTFLGQLEKSQIEPLMAQSAVLALASGYEGLSHVLLEGMASGLPIIATNIEGNRELLTDGENGWLVRPGDASGFASAIRECLSSPAQAAEYGRRNRAWSLAHTIEQQVEATLEVCLEAMATRGR